MNLDSLSKISADFVQELIDAKEGKKTSLPFIKHQYSAESEVKNGELFQVLVIGGSVYKSALVKRNRKKFSIVSFREGKQPIFKSDTDFLAFVAEQIDPTIRVLAINMAFPLTPVFLDGRLDGVLAYATKEHTFDGLIGKPVAKTVMDYMRVTKDHEIVASTANDTICLLLSGLTQYDWDQVAAGIVGTGMNFALFMNENALVNLEAANFDKFEQTQEAKVVDMQSSKPGMARSEKEVAGAYLYQVFNEGIKLRGLECQTLTSTDQIDQLVTSGKGPVAEYAEELLERSAGIVAAQIAGITMYLGRDTAFVMEGSLFWKGNRYRDRVQRYVTEIIPQFSVSYILIPDSGIMGAAKLVA